MYWAKSHFEIWKQEFMKSTFPAGWNYFILFSNPIRRSAAANLSLDLALCPPTVLQDFFVENIVKFYAYNF